MSHAFYLFALFIVLGSTTYYVWQWNVYGTLFFGLFTTLYAAKKYKAMYCKIITPHIARPPFHFFLILALQCYLLISLFQNQTVAALRSPWEIIPSHFFLLFGIATFLLLTYCMRTCDRTTWIIVALHALLLLSIVSILFPLGFGFDSFVHRSAIEHIAAHNVITPKTPYYIGAYIPAVSFAHIFGAQFIDLFDRFFLPLLAACALPFFIYKYNALYSEKLSALLSGILIFMIPFATFTITTPQGLADLFGIIAVLLTHLHASNDSLRTPRFSPIIFALASLTIHPLSGIPAILYVLIFEFLRHFPHAQYKIIILGALVTVISLPLTLSLAAHLPLQAIVTLFGNWQMPHFPFSLALPRPFDPFLDLMYTARFLMPILLIIAVTCGFIAMKKHNKSRAIATLLLPLALFVSAGFITNLQFPTIIYYEHENFSNRIAAFSLFLLLPLFSSGIAAGITKIALCSKKIRFAGSILATIFILSGVFFSYPRQNPVEASHGYTVSQNDFDAVQAIAKDAGTTPYIVLGNQALSAAALRMHGFSNYYETEKGEQYFYAIPTGGPLYNYFLKMIYESPDAKIAHNAMQFMGVARLYFVVHDYWWNAKKILSLAQNESQRSFSINDKIHVFVYNLD